MRMDIVRLVNERLGFRRLLAGVLSSLLLRTALLFLAGDLFLQLALAFRRLILRLAVGVSRLVCGEAHLAEGLLRVVHRLFSLGNRLSSMGEGVFKLLRDAGKVVPCGL